jgi:phosphoglycerate dehydrogenase-like enzyme
MTHGKRFRRWPWQEQTQTIIAVGWADATALVVGLGIGAEAARLLAAFGVTVLATDARRTVAPSGVAELHPPDATQPLQRRP